MMKHSLVIVSLFWLSATVAAELPFTLQVEPNPLVQGGEGTLRILTQGARPTATMPAVDGLVWLNHGRPSYSYQTTVINGKTTQRIDQWYRFRTTRAGKLVIPSFTVRLGDADHRTEPIVVTVVAAPPPAPGEPSLDQLIYLRVACNGSPTPPASLVLGEVVKLTIRLYVDQRIQLLTGNYNEAFTHPQNYFPGLEATNAIWRDFADMTRFNRHFLFRDRPATEVHEGRTYQVFEYDAAMLPMQVGTMQATITHRVPYWAASGASAVAGFLHGNRELRYHEMKVPLPPIEVKPLPLPDEDGTFLGLVGDWQVALTLDRPSVPVGGDLSLRLQATGSGNLEGFAPPDLKLPGFNVYEPKVERVIERDRQSVTVTWVIVPRSLESRLPAYTYLTFDPVASRYVAHPAMLELTVVPAEAVTGGGPRVVDSSPTTPMAAVPDEPTRIRYRRTDRGAWLVLPLWQHRLPWNLGLLLAGPMAFLLLVGWQRRRSWRQAPALQRRQFLARRGRRRLLQRLLRADANDLPALVREEVVPWLTAMLGLPPGTTVDELCAALNDPALADQLQACEDDSFRPGQRRTLDAALLVARLKQLSIIVICFLGLAAGLRAEPLAEAATAYDDERYADAAAIYGELLREDQGNATLAYNLGNCAYYLHRRAEARAWYEQARRLHPRDPDIRTNLVVVRHELGIAADEATDPVTMLARWRDFLRPDEWLTLAAAGWLLAWLGGAFVKRWQRRWWETLVVATAVALTLALPAWWQGQSSYRPGQAVVTRPAAVYPVPGAEAGPSAFKLDEGVVLRVVEADGRWARVRAGANEGWMRLDDMQLYW